MGEILETANEILNPNEDTGCFNLSYTERMLGFGICAVSAIFSGILAIVSLFILNLRKFSVLYTLSAILILISLLLLIGFKKIFSTCIDPKRALSSLGIIGGMLITLIFGMFLKFIILAIAGFLLQVISFLYFILSYIPGGERIFHLILF